MAELYPRGVCIMLMIGNRCLLQGQNHRGPSDGSLWRMSGSFGGAPRVAAGSEVLAVAAGAFPIGSRSRNVVPSPSRLERETVPPCASAIHLVMASPRPLPPTVFG